MDSPIVWAIILLAFAVCLFCLEASAPTGGMIAVLAAISLVGGIFMLFEVSTTTGLIGAVVTIVLGIPLALIVIVKVWPNTPMARAMTLRSPQGEPEGGGPGAAAEGLPRVGQTGKVVSDMRPIGACLIDGRRYQCLADSGFIPAGTSVRVIAADGMQIKVRAEEG